MAPSADLRVRLTPRAGREQVTLREDGTLAVRVAAPPVEGRANAALERAVAKALGVPPSRILIVTEATEEHIFFPMPRHEARRALGWPDPGRG